MKNIWDEGVSFEHILHTIPGGNGVKTSFTSFERDSK